MQHLEALQLIVIITNRITRRERSLATRRFRQSDPSTCRCVMEFVYMQAV